MGADILYDILSEVFFSGQDELVNTYIGTLDYKEVFNCEATFLKQVGVDITPILSVIFGYAFYMLCLKFVWKGLNTYILGLDGDEDADPFVLILNFGKALIISLAFGLLFTYLLNIAGDVTDKIMAAAKLKDVDLAWTIKNSFTNLGTSILLSIYLILTFVLQVLFVGNAIQLVYLRMGISFSTIGLLDSDGGSFKPYVKKFFQICFTVVVQVLSFKLSAYAVTQLSFVWAFALLMMAIKAPAFLQEFIMVNQSGGGKLQSALYSYSILRSFRKR